MESDLLERRASNHCEMHRKLHAIYSRFALDLHCAFSRTFLAQYEHALLKFLGTPGPGTPGGQKSPRHLNFTYLIFSATVQTSVSKGLPLCAFVQSHVGFANCNGTNLGLVVIWAAIGHQGTY
jgi:hypothetical protein